MRRRFMVLGVVLGLILATVSGTYAAEMPSADDLQAQMEAPAGTVTVYEPHLSVGDEHSAVDYVGYPAVDVMARLFGADWPSQAETVEFRALDGYVSRIAVERFLTEGAYIVFMRGDGSPFTVDNLAQNQTGVPLGPYYLVWDNIGNPALLAEGAGNWPYQVVEVNLVTLSDAALLPPGLDTRFHEGAALAKTHCLSCHKVNGYGGEKSKGNLAKIAKDYAELRFVRLVLTPRSVLSKTTMPPLSDGLAEPERERIAKALFDYLAALPDLP